MITITLVLFFAALTIVLLSYLKAELDSQKFLCESLLKVWEDQEVTVSLIKFIETNWNTDIVPWFIQIKRFGLLNKNYFPYFAKPQNRYHIQSILVEALECYNKPFLQQLFQAFMYRKIISFRWLTMDKTFTTWRIMK